MRDPDKRRKSDNRWRAANRQKIVERVVKWQRANPEKVYENQLRWRLTHPAKHRANVAKRKAMKLAQRCGCCTNSDIQNLYDIAALCGAGAHVDHKITLRLGGHHCI